MTYYLWVQVGDTGEYERFANLDDAIDYLNELCVGQVLGWVEGGFTTPNYHGYDYISLYWGDSKTNWLADLDDEDQYLVEHRLEEHYL